MFSSTLESIAHRLSIVVHMEGFQLFTGPTVKISMVFTEVLEYLRFYGNYVQGAPFRDFAYERYKASSTEHPIEEVV